MISTLSPAELDLLASVFRRHPAIREVKLFGSRAKGNHTPRSDIDLAIWGEVDALEVQQVAADLDDLPLPYRFDVQRFDRINLPELRAHIERVGVSIYSLEIPSDGLIADRS
jgi:uncharacterized protein